VVFGGNVNGKLRRAKIGITLAVTSVVMMLGFNNCQGDGALDLNSQAPGGGGLNSGSVDDVTGTLCEQDIKRFYSRAWLGFLKTQCAACHTDGPGKGRFTSNNINEAFDEFMMIGQDKVAKNATSPNHNPPATGTHHFMEVNEMKVDYLQALDKYAACSGDSSVIPVEPPIERITLFSAEKDIGALIENTPINQVRTLTWDINTEIYSLSDAQEIPDIPGAGTISIQIGRYKNSAGNTYYSFFNPTLSGNTVDMNIVGIFIRMNGILLNYPTTFSFVDAKLQDMADKKPAGTQSELISTGSIVAPKIISPSDKISLQFIEIKSITLPPPPLPNPVNFVVRDSGGVPSFSSVPILVQPQVDPNFRYDRPMEMEFEIGLQRPADDTVTVTFSDISEMCGLNYGLANDNLQQSMRRLSATCEAQVFTQICAGRSDCNATTSTARNEFAFMRARSVQGAVYRRFDWDYRIDNRSVSFSPGQQFAKVKVYLSTNIRRTFNVPLSFPASVSPTAGEANRLLTLRLESVTGEGVMGTNVNANLVVRKHNNPVPPSAPPGEPSILRYQDMMSSVGVLELNCVKCHNSDDNAGSYDMTNFELMVQNGVLKPGGSLFDSEMYTRMTKDFGNLAKPMPNDGFMVSSEVDKVKRWIEAGAPNN